MSALLEGYTYDYNTIMFVAIKRSIDYVDA